MLNSGKKINILTLVLSEKKILNETKNHNPPCKLNGQSLNDCKARNRTCPVFCGNRHCV